MATDIHIATIPTHTFQAIQNWIEHAPHPRTLGSFVRALLSNDLRAAVTHADSENFGALRITLDWIYFNVPSAAWGSPEKLLAYHNHKKVA